MEQEARARIKQEYLPKILTVGLIMSCISVILSVQYQYDNQKYIDLIISSALFVIMLLLIRWLK